MLNMIVRMNAILNKTLVTVNDFIGKLYESHKQSHENNLCNDAQKVHYDSFCHRELCCADNDSLSKAGELGKLGFSPVLVAQ